MVYIFDQGFDERIQSYGWETNDLLSRLSKAGLEIQETRSNSLFKATDSDSTDLFENKKLNTEINKLNTQKRNSWESKMSGIKFKLSNVKNNHYVAKLSNQVNSLSENNDAIILEANINLLEKHGMFITSNPFTVNYLTRLSRSYEAAKNKPTIIIHAQYGLASKIRAVASAIVLANALDRHLRIIWIPDIHCEAKFEDLFEIGNLDVWEIFDYAELTFSNIEIFAKQEISTLNNVYIKTNEYIKSKFISRSEISLAIKNHLKPISKILKSFEISPRINYMGVHIRNQASTLDSTFANIKSETVESFISEMKRQVKNNSDLVFFVSADSKEALDLVLASFEEPRILYLKKIGCVKPNVECLQIALADLFILGASKYGLIGSSSSAFTDVAALLANVDNARIAGVDFVEENSNQKFGVNEVDL